ncbi:MAG: aminodeoxychorismate synthase component I [Rickettsiales bacterium]|nr:aminodeoxychorismate synthase component I [Rickettsiales bacterium]
MTELINFPVKAYASEKFQWSRPLEVAKRIYQNYSEMVVLYSSASSDHSGRFSYIAYDALKTMQSSDINALEDILSDNTSCFENCWMGYLGYELKNSIESFNQDQDSFIELPALYLIKFSNILVFDHHQQDITLYYHNKKALAEFDDLMKESLDSVSTTVFLQVTEALQSNMSKQDYLEKLDYIKQKILAGDIYQANLTRKFYGSITKSTDLIDVFATLCELSPSCYSAFLHWDDVTILSSSPEQFITIDADGIMESRPIKGTSPRHHDNAMHDQIARDFLENSEKDKAENLMIVDLMRNDFSRGAEIGSVKVSNLFNVKSYQTVHHMDSTISAKRKSEVSTASVVKNCFPPGSMTGTPKIRAMEICSEVEAQNRGVYSGTIGWFGGDGSCDLSVVIRTLILKGNNFEFQVGGAITYDSDPIAEWEETIAKARALLAILGLNESAMRDL